MVSRMHASCTRRLGDESFAFELWLSCARAPWRFFRDRTSACKNVARNGYWRRMFALRCDCVRMELDLNIIGPRTRRKTMCAIIEATWRPTHSRATCCASAVCRFFARLSEAVGVAARGSLAAARFGERLARGWCANLPRTFSLLRKSAKSMRRNFFRIQPQNNSTGLNLQNLEASSKQGCH